MSLTNTDKPTTSYTNIVKPSFAELWSTITTTWAGETRTWGECASIMDNVSRATAGISNTAKP